MKSSGEDKELTSYMDQMEEELARTSIGESFEKVNGICLLLTEQARSARPGDKGDAREARQGMMRTSAERARKREVIPPLSFVINSNFPQSDRERLGTRQEWDIFLDPVGTKWVIRISLTTNEKFSVLTTFRVYCFSQMHAW